MLPFMTQPAVAAACYVPRGGSIIPQAQTFRGGQYLLRTPAAAGSLRRWTMRMMVHRHGAATDQRLMSVMHSTGNYNHVLFDADRIGFQQANGGTMTYDGFGATVHRDYGGWLDVVLAVDADAGTVVITTNGVAETLSVSVNTLAGRDTWINGAEPHAIGVNELALNSAYLSATIADVYFVDGAALPASAWGEANIHGVWVPRPKDKTYAAIAAAGGWGVNGFHLDFSDPLNPGKDVSGKGNHWTATGFDATGRDTVASTPTNRYATLNPLSMYSGVTLSDGNLRTQQPSSGTGRHVSTLMATGSDVQAEVTMVSLVGAALRPIGAVPPEFNPAVDDYLTGGLRYDGAGGTVVSAGGVTLASGLATTVTGDTVGLLLRPAAGTLGFYKVSGSGGAVTDLGTYPLGSLAGQPLRFAGASGHAHAYRWNFGQQAFLHPVAGVQGLCTDALAEPDIADPTEGLAQAIATGANILGVLEAGVAHWNGQWIEIVKRRDASEDWRVRCSDDPANSWATNTPNAKAAAPALASAAAYVGYRLRVGRKYGIWTAEVAHTTGTATTVTHGLGTTRNAVIATRISAGGGDRYYRHPDMASGHLGTLNGTADTTADSSLTAFGADTLQLGAGAPSGTYRVVVLAERPGYLSLSKVTGNGAADGAFAPMDIAPDFAMIRASNGGTNNTVIVDRARSPVNPAAAPIYPNLPAVEGGAVLCDMVVGGIKWRTASTSTATILAIGRPIGGVCVAPATAR